MEGAHLGIVGTAVSVPLLVLTNPYLPSLISDPTSMNLPVPGIYHEAVVICRRGSLKSETMLEYNI
jgi:hypothetical protein